MKKVLASVLALSVVFSVVGVASASASFFPNPKPPTCIYPPFE